MIRGLVVEYFGSDRLRLKIFIYPYLGEPAAVVHTRRL